MMTGMLRTGFAFASPRGLWLVVLCFFFPAVTFAQTFSGSVNKSKVGVGEKFRINYRLENVSGNNFRLPPLTGFNVVAGPYQSQQMQVVNGVMSQSTQIAYDLEATKTGSFTIPAATFQTAKGTLKSNTINVEVVEGSTGGQNNANNPPPVNGGSSKDILFVVTADRNSIYQGEQVTLTIKLYSQFNNIQVEEIKLPEFRGGWVQDIPEAVDQMWKVENYNGKRYYSAVFKKSILVPSTTGKVIFDPVTATLNVQRLIRSNDMWQDFFFGQQVQNDRVKLVSNKVEFNVLPLPEDGRPESFRNAVGNLKFSAAIDKTEVEANDAVTLKLSVNGNGNFMLMDNPKTDFPSTFEVPDPLVKDKYKVTLSGITGSKEYEYLIIPRSGGDFALGPFKFSYFDPATRKYQEVVSDTLHLKVNGAVIENITSSGEPVEDIARDIRYIDDHASTLHTLHPFFFRTPLYFLLLLIPFPLLIVVIALRRKIFGRTRDMEQYRMRHADSVAIKRLQQAKKMLDENQRDRYYEELNKALLGYLTDKYAIAFADMNREFIRERLTDKGLDAQLVHGVTDVLEKCEFARFAPSSGEERTDLYQETVQLITSLEKQK